MTAGELRLTHECKLYPLGMVALSALKDAMGNLVPTPRTHGLITAQVVFVDLNPDANWGHQCAYIIIDPETNDFDWYSHDWPPSHALWAPVE